MTSRVTKTKLAVTVRPSARVTGARNRKRICVPREVAEFIHSGGVDGRVREAMEEAARFERKFCLERLEAMQKDLDPASVALQAAVYIDVQIKRLRRSLGIKPTPEEKREQTRLRVQEHRAKKRAAGS